MLVGVLELHPQRAQHMKPDSRKIFDRLVARYAILAVADGGEGGVDETRFLRAGWDIV